MIEIGKFLINIGAITIFIGVVFFILGKLPFMGKLPGDIMIKRENFSFYFPLTTSILISIFLSIIITIISNFKK